MKINGKQHYLWRAVDEDGEVVDVYLQARRDGAAAKFFFKRLLGSNAGGLRKIVTDKLRSYGVAHLELTLRSAICSIWEGTRSGLTSIGFLR